MRWGKVEGRELRHDLEISDLSAGELRFRLGAQLHTSIELTSVRI